MDLDRSADDTADWLFMLESPLLGLLAVLLVCFLPAFLPSLEVFVGCPPKSVRHPVTTEQRNADCSVNLVGGPIVVNNAG